MRPTGCKMPLVDLLSVLMYGSIDLTFVQMMCEPGCLAPFASASFADSSPRLDGHSSADFLRYLDQHVATHESTLEVTKDMYKRIGQLQQRGETVEEGAPLRIHAEMSTPKMCPGPHCKEYKFLAEKLMPAALKEVTRRYKITRPTKGALRLPMQCKTTLPSGNCGEVRPFSYIISAFGAGAPPSPRSNHMSPSSDPCFLCHSNTFKHISRMLYWAPARSDHCNGCLWPVRLGDVMHIHANAHATFS